MILNRTYGRTTTGLFPQVVVTSKNGSIVTCDSNPPDATEIGTEDTQFYFTLDAEVLPYAYTIVGTYNSKTVTETVLVTAVEQYAVTLVYSRLPAGYTEVEYLQANASQLIKLDYTTNYGFSIRSKLILDQQPSSSTYMAFAGQSGAMGSFLRIRYSYGAYTNELRIESGNANCSQSINLAINTEYDFYFIAKTTYFAIYQDGVLLREKTVLDGGRSNYPLGIGGMCYRTTSEVRNGFEGKIKETHIYNESDVEIYDLVPCIDSSNVPGFYDLINQQFLHSSTGTEFIAGSPV